MDKNSESKFAHINENNTIDLDLAVFDKVKTIIENTTDDNLEDISFIASIYKELYTDCEKLNSNEQSLLVACAVYLYEKKHISHEELVFSCEPFMNSLEKSWIPNFQNLVGAINLLQNHEEYKVRIIPLIEQNLYREDSIDTTITSKIDHATSRIRDIKRINDTTIQQNMIKKFKDLPIVENLHKDYLEIVTKINKDIDLWITTLASLTSTLEEVYFLLDSWTVLWWNEASELMKKIYDHINKNIPKYLDDNRYIAWKMEQYAVDDFYTQHIIGSLSQEVQALSSDEHFLSIENTDSCEVKRNEQHNGISISYKNINNESVTLLFLVSEASSSIKVVHENTGWFSFIKNIDKSYLELYLSDAVKDSQHRQFTILLEQIQKEQQSQKEYRDQLCSFDINTFFWKEQSQYIPIFPQKHDYLISKVLPHQSILWNVLWKKYPHMNMETALFTDDPKKDLFDNIKEQYNSWTQAFYLDFYTHGSKNKLMYEEPINAEDIVNFIRKDCPNAKFIVSSIACYGWWLVQWFTDALKQYPELQNNIALFTQSKWYVSNFLARYKDEDGRSDIIWTTYLPFFIEGLEKKWLIAEDGSKTEWNGETLKNWESITDWTYGDAHNYADQKVYEMHEGNPESIIPDEYWKSLLIGMHDNTTTDINLDKA